MLRRSWGRRWQAGRACRTTTRPRRSPRPSTPGSALHPASGRRPSRPVGTEAQCRSHRHQSSAASAAWRLAVAVGARLSPLPRRECFSSRPPGSTAASFASPTRTRRAPAEGPRTRRGEQPAAAAHRACGSRVRRMRRVGTGRHGVFAQAHCLWEGELSQLLLAQGEAWVGTERAASGDTRPTAPERGAMRRNGWRGGGSRAAIERWRKE